LSLSAIGASPYSVAQSRILQPETHWATVRSDRDEVRHDLGT
jgi:hypothetical protein